MIWFKKGEIKHEKDTLNEVVKLRNNAYNEMSYDEKIKGNEQLSLDINKLMVLAETYPDLKANENFKDLSNQLSSVEEDIANARKYYNGAARIMNDKVQMFPSNLIASMLGFKKQPMFEVNEAERENVKVEF